jgi:limonene 1,2-monooxygenase
MRKVKLRAGMFLAPFHPLDENPTLTFERDLELARYADELGFAEFWYGEHHSGGYENSASPELMIAAAAQRTKRIKLGTGVVSLPYHNPLMTANRIAQLDHLTFGRLIFGAGPGLLVSDAHMLGLDARESRDKLDQGLSVITRLLRGEWVTEKSSWYDLRNAHCQVLPMSEQLEICVASTFSPNGGKLAAKYDAGMLCLASTVHSGFDTLSTNWEIACDAAAKDGRTMSPASMRCATDVHIAETRDDAIAQVRKGYERCLLYIKNQSEQIKDSPAHKTLDELIETNQVVVGTPDNAIAAIRRLEEKVPDFGCLLMLDKNCANTQDKKRSMELFARYVLPAVNAANVNRAKSFDWCRRVHKQAARQVQRPGEQRRQFLLAFDLAFDVADHAPELGSERSERLAGALELMGMRVTLVLDQRVFADPRIGLTQHHAIGLGQPDQPLARPVQQLRVGREHHILELHRRIDGEPGEVAGLGCARPGGHGQALLNERSQSFVAHALAPAGQR